jgi:hypothetical protein
MVTEVFAKNAMMPPVCPFHGAAVITRGAAIFTVMNCATRTACAALGATLE